MSEKDQILEIFFNLDLAPFLKYLSGNGFENNFKAMTSSNIGTNLEIPEKFQPNDRRGIKHKELNQR